MENIEQESKSKRYKAELNEQEIIRVTRYLTENRNSEDFPLITERDSEDFNRWQIPKELEANAQMMLREVAMCYNYTIRFANYLTMFLGTDENLKEKIGEKIEEYINKFFALLPPGSNKFPPHYFTSREDFLEWYRRLTNEYTVIRLVYQSDKEKNFCLLLDDCHKRFDYARQRFYEHLREQAKKRFKYAAPNGMTYYETQRNKYLIDNLFVEQLETQEPEPEAKAAKLEQLKTRKENVEVGLAELLQTKVKVVKLPIESPNETVIFTLKNGKRRGVPNDIVQIEGKESVQKHLEHWDAMGDDESIENLWAIIRALSYPKTAIIKECYEELKEIDDEIKTLG